MRTAAARVLRGRKKGGRGAMGGGGGAPGFAEVGAAACFPKAP
jgi:hypothetical protein